jgi:hypothetical protein
MTWKKHGGVRSEWQSTRCVRTTARERQDQKPKEAYAAVCGACNSWVYTSTKPAFCGACGKKYTHLDEHKWPPLGSAQQPLPKPTQAQQTGKAATSPAAEAGRAMPTDSEVAKLVQEALALVAQKLGITIGSLLPSWAVQEEPKPRPAIMLCNSTNQSTTKLKRGLRRQMNECLHCRCWQRHNRCKRSSLHEREKPSCASTRPLSSSNSLSQAKNVPLTNTAKDSRCKSSVTLKLQSGNMTLSLMQRYWTRRAVMCRNGTRV